MKKIILAFIAGALIASAFTVSAINYFNDDADIPAWASEAIYNLRTQGLVSGYPDNTFKPNNNITRAEMAVIMNRFLQLLEREGVFD